MKKAILLAAAAACTLLLLMVAAAGVFLAVFNPNDYKDAISEKIFQATGRQALILGDLQVSFFPAFSLNTGPFSISDPPGFGSEPFIEAGNLSLRIALAPLLGRRLVVEEAILEGARLKLVETSTGLRNWETGLVRRGLSDGSTDQPGQPVPLQEAVPAGSRGRALDIRLDRLSSQDLEVVYRDLSRNLTYSLNLDAITATGLETGGTAALSLAGKALEAGRGLSASFSLEASAGPDAQGTWPGRFDLSGELSRPGKSLPFALRSGFVYHPGRQVSAPDLVLAAGPASLAGSLSLDFPQSGQPGKLVSAVTSEMLDLDSLLAVAEALAQEPAAGGPGPRNLPVERVAGSRVPEGPKIVEEGQPALPHFLQELDVDIRYDLSTLEYSGIHLSPVAVVLAAKGGVAVLDLEASVAGGKLSAGLTADLSASPPQVSLLAELTGAEISVLLAGLTGRSSLISGTAAGMIDVRGSGLDSSLIPGLQGQASLNLQDGRVTGFDRIPSGLPHVPDIPKDFLLTQASATFAINEGIASTTDLRVDSPALRANGRGTANLVSRQASLRADLILPVEKAPVIPLVISGPFGSLSWAVDLDVLLKNAASQAIEREAERVMRHIPDNAGEILRGVDGLLRRR